MLDITSDVPRTLFRITVQDILALPEYFQADLSQVVSRYIQSGIVQPEDVAGISRHQDFYVLPKIFATHKPYAPALSQLRQLAEGFDIQYCVSDPDKKLRDVVPAWLELYDFPCAKDVLFCEMIAEKLAVNDYDPRQVVLIDKRAASLIKAYNRLVVGNPAAAALVLERLTIAVYGVASLELDDLSVPDGLRVRPLRDFSDVEFARFRSTLVDSL